jgi:hypothetical protein
MSSGSGNVRKSGAATTAFGAFAGNQAAALGRADHHPGDLDAGYERQLGADLVLAARHEEIDEAHARGVDLDEDHRGIGIEVGQLLQRERVGAAGLPQQEGAHGREP